MKIAIVSDTHNNEMTLKKVIDYLKKEKIKLILHCGDIGSPEFLNEAMKNFDGEIYGVLGNMDIDYKTMLADYNIMPKIKIEEKVLKIEIENKKIAITHKPEDAKILAETGKYGVVFYGHTHKPCLEKKRQCIIANPGELAGQIFKPSFAIYDTKNDLLELKILERI